jgi:hypothetical protein
VRAVPTLTTEVLLNLPDDAVRAFVTSQFVAQLRSSPSVRGFFGTSESVAPKNQSFVDDLGVAFACSSIAHSSLYGFAGTVNGSAADHFWQAGLADTNASAVAEGQALYDWAFPAYCKSSDASFSDFLGNNPTQWAADLSAYVTTTPYIDTTINKIFSDPGWLDQLNLTLYKIDRLDPTKTAAVLAVWQKAYPAKEIVQDWNQRNFVPQANFADLPEQMLGEVNAQIGAEQTYQSGGTDTGEAGWQQPVYGMWVAYDFLGIQPPYPNLDWNQNSRPRQLGFLSGASPDNLGESSPSCFVGGTLVPLADGRSVPIETVAEGQGVLAKDGAVSIRTSETVVITARRGVELFGFDHAGGAEEPFFSGGHLFWTADGWKAVKPSVALAQNPDRAVGQLAVGDCVLRLVSTDPVAYEDVEITAITRKVLAAETPLYSLHLADGPRSYHANGFLVGMNYPVVTIGRLVDGLGRLTEHERRVLRRHLEPVIPLLEAAIGPFVRMVVDMAYGPDHRSDTSEVTR